MNFTRRDTIVLGAAASVLSLCGVGVANAAEGDMIDVARLMAPAGGVADHVQGSQSAPVTVIEYASPTCPHCATFSNEVLPALVEQYVDTGKIKLIVRPFVRNVLDAAVFMLAKAAGPTNFHNVLATYFRTQTDWATSETPRDAIFEIATQLGFTQATFDAALTDQELFTGMEAVREQALNEFGLSGTPTFYINGKTLTGNKTLEQFAAEIDPLVPTDFVSTSAGAAPAVETPDATLEPTREGALPTGGTVSPASPDAIAPTEPAATVAPTQ